MKKQLSLFFTFLMLFSYVHSTHMEWSTPPTIISGKHASARNPEIAIDPNGNTVAVWVEKNLLQSRTKLDGSDWDAPITISENGASSVKMVLDNDGNATVIWYESGLIKTASKPLYGEWSPATTLSNCDLANSLALAISNTGDVIAAWVFHGNVETSTKCFGSDWGPKLDLNSTSASQPSIHIGGSGKHTRAVLVWEGSGNGQSVIFASTKLIKENWSSPKMISEIEHKAAKPNVTVDKIGNAIALWYAYDELEGNEYNTSIKSAAFSILSRTWSEVVTLSLPGILHPSKAKACVKFDDNGNAIALWSLALDNKTYTLQSAIKPLNAPWNKPISLAYTKGYVLSMDLGVTSEGDALALYMFKDGYSLTIQSIETEGNGFLDNTWAAPITISEGTDNAFPQVALSCSENAIHAAAVWISYIDGNKEISCSMGSKALPQTTIVNEE